MTEELDTMREIYLSRFSTCSFECISSLSDASLSLIALSVPITNLVPIPPMTPRHIDEANRRGILGSVFHDALLFQQEKDIALLLDN